MSGPATKQDDDVLVRNPLVFKRVKTAVDTQLSAKGYIQKLTGPTDFMVAVQAGIKERMYMQPYPPAFYYHRGFYRGRIGWYYPWWDPYMPPPPPRYYEEGTLIVDIIDGRTGDLAWRGMARGIVQDYDNIESMQEDINDAVFRILAKFPPLSR
jgi:hypothetical protein